MTSNHIQAHQKHVTLSAFILSTPIFLGCVYVYRSLPHFFTHLQKTSFKTKQHTPAQHDPMSSLFSLNNNQNTNSIFSKPLTNLIIISSILSIGFLFIILSVSLYNTYGPLVNLLFLFISILPKCFIKVIPNTCIKNNSEDNRLDTFNVFFSNFFLWFFMGLNVVQLHTGIMNIKCFILSLIGDVLIYSQIIMFLYTFSNYDHDLLEDDDEYYY